MKGMMRMTIYEIAREMLAEETYENSMQHVFNQMNRISISQSRITDEDVDYYTD